MRHFILFSFLFCLINIFSQQYYFGDLQSRYRIDKSQYFSKNTHTISKPYLICKEKDTLKQFGLWEYSASMKDAKIKVLPLLSGMVNYENDLNLITNSFLLGTQINIQNNKRFFSQFRFGYQKGTISKYQIFSNYKRPLAPGVGYLNDTAKNNFNKPLIEGVLSYKLNNYFVFSGGVGQHFFGDGYRSLWLSDFAPSFPFLKLESTFWKVKYINLWSLHDDLHSNLFSSKKWSSSHMLSLNITDWLNFSVFESIVWQAKDSLNNRGFDINYLNPFVFFRPVEYGIGSADNSFLGAGLKISIRKHYVVYSNFILDEFLLSQFKTNNGWWGNKYGFQIGIKAYDLFNLEGLYSLIEYNSVRPYTYSHMSSMQNYGHKNHSLAHPLESNFMEGLFLIGYQRGNFDFLFQFHMQHFGKDISNNNYGGNMFISYNDRYNNNHEYGHVIGQGNITNQQIINSRISWMLSTMTNTKLFTQFNFRISTDKDSDMTSTMINFGISSNLWQSYFDY